MQIDKDKFQKFLNLNDEEFKKKIADAAKSAGLETSKLNDVLKDTKKIKNTLGSMNEDDIKCAVKAMGDEKVAQVIQNIQNNQKN